MDKKKRSKQLLRYSKKVRGEKMTEELRKELKEELDSRLRDLLFEEPKKAFRRMRTIIREVLKKYGISDDEIITSCAGNDLSAIISLGGRRYECKIVSKSVDFKGFQPEAAV